MLKSVQRYSAYCHRVVKKQENIYIQEAGIKEFWRFLNKKKNNIELTWQLTEPLIIDQ